MNVAEKIEKIRQNSEEYIENRKRLIEKRERRIKSMADTFFSSPMKSTYRSSFKKSNLATSPKSPKKSRNTQPKGHVMFGETMPNIAVNKHIKLKKKKKAVKTINLSDIPVKLPKQQTKDLTNQSYYQKPKNVKLLATQSSLSKKTETPKFDEASKSPEQNSVQTISEDENGFFSDYAEKLMQKELKELMPPPPVEKKEEPNKLLKSTEDRILKNSCLYYSKDSLHKLKQLYGDTTRDTAKVLLMKGKKNSLDLGEYQTGLLDSVSKSLSKVAYTNLRTKFKEIRKDAYFRPINNKKYIKVIEDEEEEIINNINERSKKMENHWNTDHSALFQFHFPKLRLRRVGKLKKKKKEEKKDGY